MPKPESLNTPSPAFKEWRVIVEALGAGEQILILRKGGIAENRGGFQVEAKRFWLFPTQFHAQREKTKPAAAGFFQPAAAPENALTLRFFADVVHAAFLDRWDEIARLDDCHLWTEATLRERFDWGKPPGLHALVVRVHRLREPVTLAVTAAMSGCKSWIELPVALDAAASEPVLDDEAFAARRRLIAGRMPALGA
ncbi:MAG: DUF1802 family protein [Verrucomicrobia bacterium]|nr:DUF1802 family protein [Verrucomicrobiota bacterium]